VTARVVEQVDRKKDETDATKEKGTQGLERSYVELLDTQRDFFREQFS